MERLWLWLFPRRCLWCGSVCFPREMFCARCAQEGMKHRKPLLFLREDLPLVAVLPYQSPVRKRFLDLKFMGQRHHASSIGYAMADALAASWETLSLSRALPALRDCLFVPIPMTRMKQRQRGYNQSALILKFAARWLHADRANLLFKSRETEEQHQLSGEARRQNVVGVYRAAPHVPQNKTIVLVDDICTTGATMTAAADALLAAGAAQIICCCYLTGRVAESDQPEPDQNEPDQTEETNFVS